MAHEQLVTDKQLTALAKKYRLASGKTKAEAAGDLGVSRPTMQLAEENPEQSLTRLRRRIIERYSPYKVVGPLFVLRRRQTSR